MKSRKAQIRISARWRVKAEGPKRKNRELAITQRTKKCTTIKAGKNQGTQLYGGCVRGFKAFGGMIKKASALQQKLKLKINRGPVREPGDYRTWQENISGGFRGAGATRQCKKDIENDVR